MGNRVGKIMLSAISLAAKNVRFWTKADIGADGQARLAVCRFSLAAVALWRAEGPLLALSGYWRPASNDPV